MTPYRIAIVGCGVAGLSAGVLLARAGHAVTLFERFEQPKSVGAGILLQPSGLVALDRLGLREPVEAKAARIDALVGTTHTGKRIMDVRYADVWPDIYGLGVHRGNLFGVLYESALAAGVEVRCGMDIVDILPAGAQKYSCCAAKGEAGGAYDAVIIANGTQSKLRARLKVKQRNVPYPWGALWAICPDPEQRIRGNLLQRYDGTSVMIGLLPTGLHPQTGTPCVSFFWSLRTRDYPAWQRGDLEAWKRQVLGYWPEIEYFLGGISNPSMLTFATYGDVIMNRWHAEGVVCIGDAGHGMSPQLGQGANLALIDAVVLADCLQQAASVPQAFEQYSRYRRNHLRYCQLASRWLTPFFQSDSKTAAFLRDFSFPVLNKVPFLYRQALETVAGVKTGLLFGKPAVDLSRKHSSLGPLLPEKYR